jgi:hypothetical protein
MVFCQKWIPPALRISYLDPIQGVGRVVSKSVQASASNDFEA